MGTPRNVSNGDRFTWRAAVEGNRFRGESLSGQDGDSFRIVPSGVEQLLAGTYRGAVTVAVEGMDGLLGAPRQIPVTLRVTDGAFKVRYLATVGKE